MGIYNDRIDAVCMKGRESIVPAGRRRFCGIAFVPTGLLEQISYFSKFCQMILV